MKILENTVYKASLNMRGQGAPESYINARPAESIGAASTWGNAVIGYDMEELEKAAELLLEDYDTLKNSDGYLYDLADVLKQVLSNSSQKYHREMVSAYRSGDLAKFNEASDQFLSLIDKVEEVLGTRKEFLFGTWTEQAKKLAEGDDDFTKDIYELNAKSLVTTWASYPQAESGGLKDYSNRQWAGLTQDFYKQRWTMWINQKKAEMKGESTQNINWFAFEWAFARSHTEYTTEASGKNLKELGEDILKNYSSKDPAANGANDYTGKVTVTAGSEETSQENGAAANVLDGSSDTIWHSNYTNAADMASYEKHYLIFIMEEAVKLGGLRYQPRQGGGLNGIIKAYEIYTSMDGENYTKAAEGNWTADTSWKLASFDKPVTAKYVKFVVKDATSEQAGKCFSSAAQIRLTVPEKTGEDKPSETEKPTETEKPNQTEKPNETEKPNRTEKPDQTEKPNQTEKPKDNKSDQNTSGSAGKIGDVIADAAGVFNYTITGNDTVEVKSMAAKGKTKKAVKISASIKANGKTYKVTGIAANAFKGNKKMTSVLIGGNVKKIGRSAFENCKNLTKVTVNGSKLQTISKNAFKGDKKLKNISLKKVKSLKKVEKAAFKGVSKKVTVKVPKNKKKAYSKLLAKGGIAAGKVRS